MLKQLNKLLKGRVTKKIAEANGFFIENFDLVARTGRKIRTATKVTLPNGKTIKFIEKMGVKAALDNVKFQLERNAEDWA